MKPLAVVERIFGWLRAFLDGGAGDNADPSTMLALGIERDNGLVDCVITDWRAFCAAVIACGEPHLAEDVEQRSPRGMLRLLAVARDGTYQTGGWISLKAPQFDAPGGTS